MITYFCKKIKSNKEKNELDKSLNSLLFKEKNEYFAVFPLCLFDSKYYTYLKQKRKSPYNGQINESSFNLERNIAYGGTTNRRIRTVYIEGKIEAQNSSLSIQLKFKTYLFAIILFVALIPISIWTFTLTGNMAFLLIFPLILIYETFIIYNDIKKIKNKTTTA